MVFTDSPCFYFFLLFYSYPNEIRPASTSKDNTFSSSLSIMQYVTVYKLDFRHVT